MMVSGTGYHQGAGFSQGPDPSGYFSQTSSCVSLAEAALQASQQKMTLLHKWRAAEEHQGKNIHRIGFYSRLLLCSPVKILLRVPGPGGVLCRGLVSIPCPSPQCRGKEWSNVSHLLLAFQTKIPQRKCTPSASGEPC